ncbi:MAG: NYN domain-containing protein [Halococcoides sp.]
MRQSTVHDGQRVAVLADAQNLYHTAQSLHSRKIDYAALLEAAVDDRALIRAIAYVIEANAPDEETFFEALEDIGYETRRKEIRTFGDGSKKADWDVGMSLDAVSLASKVDTLVLCTGDGDFARLCSHLTHEGVRVEVASFGPSTAEQLIEAAHAHYDLDENADEFLL